MNIWRRPKFVEVVVVLLILVGAVYFLEHRIPGWQERKKLSQSVIPNFDEAALQKALQSLVDQTDGSVTMTVCSSLLEHKVSLKSTNAMPLNDALREIAAQIPTKYYPYGMLDVAIAHPVFLCKDQNKSAVTIQKTSLGR